MSMVVGFCERCDWRTTVKRPEYGQSLFGTLGERMARHEGTTNHDRFGIDWEMTVIT